MDAQSITIKVSEETARAYLASPKSKKRAAEDLLELLFAPRKRTSLSQFKKLAEAASKEATEKGLTEEELAKILDEA